MSEENKDKRNKRIQKRENCIKKQFKIAKASGFTKLIDQPHRLHKHRAMDCGVPQCGVCGNPRKTKSHKPKDKLTTQEYKQQLMANDDLLHTD